MFDKPDFLVISPQRTGSTWLYRQLNNLPEFNVLPVKELSYLYEADTEEFYRSYKKGRKTNWDNFFDLIHSQSQIDYLRNSQKEIRKGNFGMAWQKRNYFFALYSYLIPRGLSEFHLFLYSRLFNKSRTRFAGEIAPLYFTLSNEAIGKVKKYFPNIKLIFVIRDPVEREWSQIVKRYYEQKDEKYFSSVDEFLRNYNAHGDYQSAIERWERYFDKEQLLYLFFDELSENPQNFLNEILKFLGSRDKFQISGEKINEGAVVKMNDVVKAKLIERNLGQYHFLIDKFSPASTPAKWLKNMLKADQEKLS